MVVLKCLSGVVDRVCGLCKRCGVMVQLGVCCDNPRLQWARRVGLVPVDRR